VFSQSEKKTFVIKLGQRWLFPDFSNKLTWAVVSVGIGVVVLPQPLKLVFFNWLVELFNLNTGKPFTLAELNTGPDYAIGAFLIAIALLHNLGYKYLQKHQAVLADQTNQRTSAKDEELLATFINEFPSNGTGAKLLRDHDFGNSFARSRLEQIDRFVEKWAGAEFRFINAAIDEKRATLVSACNSFLGKVAMYTAPIGASDFSSAIPEAFRGDDWNMPQHVHDQIREINELATKAYQAHQELIASGRGAG
jgi:hypothetical protein